MEIMIPGIPVFVAWCPILLRLLVGEGPNASLLQQTVDFDFTSGSEVDVAVDYDRDDKASGQSRAVELAVLFGPVDRLAPLGCVEGVEDGMFGIPAVPSFSGNGPNDSVPVAVSGNARGCTGIDELRA